MSLKKIALLALIFVGIMGSFALIITQTSDNTTTSQAAKPIDKSKLKEITINVKGMTCTDCEKTITTITGRKAGVDTIKANYKTQSATISYDASQINKEQLMESVGSTGYQVVGFSDESGDHKVESNQTAQTHEMKCGAGKCGTSMKCGAGKCGGSK